MVTEVNEGMPLQYADFMGVGVRSNYTSNPPWLVIPNPIL